MKKGDAMMLYYLKSGIEIFCLSTFFYWFSLWLKKDTKKNLVWYFYAYYFAFLITEFSSLSVLHSCMLYATPLVLIMLVIIHEDLLQRNFIALQKNIEKIQNDGTTLDEIVRAALYAFNKNKNFLLVLENRSELSSYIQTDYLINADLNQASFIVLMESSFFDTNKYIWCSVNGKIKSINSSWKIQIHTIQADSSSVDHTNWKHDALLITSKMDTAIIRGDAQSRLFDLIISGKIQEKLSAHQLLQLIRIHSCNHQSFKGEIKYENRNKTQHTEQQST